MTARTPLKASPSLFLNVTTAFSTSLDSPTGCRTHGHKCLSQITVNTFFSPSPIMESLRSRPSQAPRKPQKAPNKLSKPGAGPAARDRSKNRIDDKIKKRMSTRYAEISSPTQLTGLPPMPSMMGMIPAGQSPADDTALEADEDVRDRTASRDDAKGVGDDRKLLSAEDFDPTACKWEIQLFFRPLRTN